MDSGGAQVDRYRLEETDMAGIKTTEKQAMTDPERRYLFEIPPGNAMDKYLGFTPSKLQKISY